MDRSTEHGTFYWNELNTREPKKARDFYEKALGWRFETMPMPEGDYLVAHAGDKPVGGIFEMKGKQFDGVPTHWMAYIAVDDVDTRVEAATKLGATLARPAFDVPGVGRIAILKEPTGAVIGWMTPSR